MDHQVRHVLKEAKAAALSDKEIMTLVDNKARLVTHDEIKNYRNIDELLGKQKACIILYITNIQPDNSAFGHWCCVFKDPVRPHTYCYFDPYGKEPDETLGFMKPQAIQEYGNEPVLSMMLKDAIEDGNQVFYSVAPLQQHAPGDAICGRLTGLRLQYRHLDGNQFSDLMNTYTPHGFGSDDLATLLTSSIN